MPLAKRVCCGVFEKSLVHYFSYKHWLQAAVFLQGANFFHHTRNIICTLCVNAGDAMQDGVQNIFWVDTMIRKVQQTPAPHIHSHLEVFSHRNTESLPRMSQRRFW